MSAMNRKVIQALAETISKQVERFHKTEIERLIRQFNSLLGESSHPGRAVQGLDRPRFLSILHNVFGMTDDMAVAGVFRTFDKDNDGFVSVKEWIEGLSVFLRGTLDEKIKCKSSARTSDNSQKRLCCILLYLHFLCASDCFRVYDLNGDGYISRDEMFKMLKSSLVMQPTEEDPDEGIKDFVEITLKKMDHDHDGRLSFEDFEKTVKEENLLLEAFGTCLPDSKRIEMFEKHTFGEQLEY